jgi:hypothetical protein
MKVYNFIGEEGYQITILTERSVEVGRALNGTPQRESWIPCPAAICREDDNGRPLLRSESPWMCHSSSLAFTEAVVSKIGGFLSEIGELLPLDCEDEPLYIWHPLSVVDAVDLDASKDVWRVNSGRVVRIKHPVFFPPKLRGIEAFKIPQMLVSPIFFSKNAVRILSGAIGRGLKFQLVWANDELA